MTTAALEMDTAGPIQKGRHYKFNQGSEVDDDPDSTNMAQRLAIGDGEITPSDVSRQNSGIPNTTTGVIP